MHRCDTNCMVYCLQFTFKVLRPIVDTLETCYLMSTHAKLAILYVDMYETWYTLCRHIRNLVYLISTHSKRATLARDIPDLLYLMSTCQHSKTNIEGLSTQQTCTEGLYN